MSGSAGAAAERVRARVCVVGSANMDLVARVERRPGPGETVSGTGLPPVVGGKGANQALAAARAGAEVRMVGVVGDDAYGREVRAVLESDGVETSGLLAVDAPTGTAHIVVDGAGENAIVVVPGANALLTGLTGDQRERVDGCAVLLLQLEVPLSAVRDAAEHARASGVRVVLTPAPVTALPDELLRCVDLLVPNQHEAAELTGCADPAAAAEVLLRRGAASVVVTLGRAGCLYAVAGADPVRVPAPRVEAVDTTAAGDTFVGALAVALAEDRTVQDALGWAVSAAALSVQRPGASTSMPSRAEIDAAQPAAER